MTLGTTPALLESMNSNPTTGEQIMKRSDIRGFTVKLGKYWVEYVSVHHLPSALVVSVKGREDLCRIGA